MKKGDIILIPFPFSDLSGSKNRPALVLVDRGLDVIVAFVSTQREYKENLDLSLKVNLQNGLKKDSIVRLSKLATIDKSLAIGRIGEISDNAMRTLNQNLIILFQLEE